MNMASKIDEDFNVDGLEIQDPDNGDLETAKPEESEETISDEGSDESEETNSEETDEDEEVTVSIEGEEEPQAQEQNKAPSWVRELRKAHRETKKENRELRNKIEKLSTQDDSKPAESLGAKPTLEQFDYDSGKYESSLDKWYDRKREIDAAESRKASEQAEQEKAWNETLTDYGKKKADLNLLDFEDAEMAAQEVLSETQQAIILQGADNAALVIAVLGKNPKRAKEFAAITDPVKFSFAVSKLETKLKVNKRKAATKPEKRIEGKPGASSSVDSKLDKLRSDAERTGDYSKVHQYRRKLKRG